MSSYDDNGIALKDGTSEAGNLGLSRRSLLRGAAKGAAFLSGSMLAMPALAQAKPDKIVVTGLMISWRRTLEEFVGPAFESKTGIKVEFEFLPIDPLAARLKTQLDSGDGSVDVAQFSGHMANWIAPKLADNNALKDEFGLIENYDWDDVFEAARSVFTVDGKLAGIPFRYLTYILHYQPEILERVGISEAPATFEELKHAAVAVTEKFGPERYGLGIMGRESEAMLLGWHPYMLTNGGNYYDVKTREILITRKPAVESAQWFADLVTQSKAVPPESSTWEWDGVTSGGQADRYAMTVLIASYGTLMNDPALSKTAGKWAWAKMPGASEGRPGTPQAGGWGFGVADSSKNKRWAFEFVQMATSKEALSHSIDHGNCPPRASIMGDPEIVRRFGWAPVFSEQAKTAVTFPEPNDALFTTCDQQLRPHFSRILLGQVSAQEAMDAVAEDWTRTFRRAGIR